MIMIMMVMIMTTMMKTTTAAVAVVVVVVKVVIIVVLQTIATKKKTEKTLAILPKGEESSSGASSTNGENARTDRSRAKIKKATDKTDSQKHTEGKTDAKKAKEKEEPKKVASKPSSTNVMLELQGDIEGVTTRKASRGDSTMIRNVYMSGLIMWICIELNRFIALFENQVFVFLENKYSAIGDCLKIVFQQSHRLNPYGVDVSFLLTNKFEKPMDYIIYYYYYYYYYFDLYFLKKLYYIYKKQIQRLFKDKTFLIRAEIEKDSMVSSSKQVAKVRKHLLNPRRMTRSASRQGAYARLSVVDTSRRGTLASGVGATNGLGMDSPNGEEPIDSRPTGLTVVEFPSHLKVIPEHSSPNEMIMASHVTIDRRNSGADHGLSSRKPLSS
ncbi:hypothetical protein RFI_01917 [Reticulomyxa filosa]|uniref:Uncharacterized protein n=1 Tax=Reticulomyxa filosa TaxID=46433 RepID=X6PAR6_RETFI|nr:hypothetical protein RFI_01917 [Reticulomyxa filosa]|eukprot:ETO35159.1 hypothetical protein RFI_01917 [Reticulomyxa filosa]